MLISIRSKAAYLTIRILFGLLIMSFGVWGISDVFRMGSRERSVATVGPVKITGADFLSEYRKEVSRVEAIFGSRLEPEAARQLGLPQRVVEQMVGRLVLDLEVERLGLVVPDPVMRREIESDELFLDELGGFSRLRFEALLAQNRLSEAEYVAGKRRDIARRQMLSAVIAGATVPRVLVATIHGYRGERRIAESVLVPSERFADVGTPDEAALEEQYREHAERYQAPEYRALTLVRLSPEDLLAEIAVPEEALQAEYEARLGEFEVPERRRLEQIVFADEAAAKAAAEKIVAGTAFADVARETNGGDPISLGTVERDGVLPELADAAFAPAEGAVSDPVESPLGWHLIRVIEVVPATRPPEAEIRARIADDLKQQQAVDSMVGIANQFEDALAGGASLDDAAASLRLRLDKVAAVDAAGMAPEGTAVAGIADNRKLLELIAATETGEASPLSETQEGGYVIVRVDRVTASATKPLDQVRDAVIADWQAAKRAERAGEVAATIVDKIAEGGTLAATAAELGLAVKTSKAFARDEGDEDAHIAADAAAKLFEGAPGSIVSLPGRGGHVVAVLREVKGADAALDAAAVAEIEKKLAAAIAADLVDEFSAALRLDLEVEIDASAIDGLL